MAAALAVDAVKPAFAPVVRPQSTPPPGQTAADSMQHPRPVLGYPQVKMGAVLSVEKDFAPRLVGKPDAKAQAAAGKALPQDFAALVERRSAPLFL